MTTTPPTVATHFWLDQCRFGNLGDALNRPLLRWLGFKPVRCPAVGSANPDKCLFAIGSLISRWHIRRTGRPIDVWGSGWRGEPLDRERRQRLTIHAVRGPRTAAALGCSDVPLGDPALLVPRFHPRPPTPSRGPAILVPHFSEQSIPNPASVGCDAVVSMRVRQRDGWLGGSVPTAIEVIDQIASADFVLTGALHAAILAQAYGVRWAAWSGSMIDCPAKWSDWSEYLGVDCVHVADRWDGEHWWDRSGLHGRIRPLEPLIDAFPYRMKTEADPVAPDKSA